MDHINSLKKYIKYKIKYKILQQYILNNKKNINGVWVNLPYELFIIGDIHGDFYALKQSLELTGCIIFDKYYEALQYDNINNLYYINDSCQYYSVKKKNIRWNKNKNNIFIVIAGDIIDRCRYHPITNPYCINTVNDENCDYYNLKLLFDLDKEARKFNSRIIIILGNHEILNLENDLRYVSNKGKNDKSRLINLHKILKYNINNIYGIIRIGKYIIVHGGINDLYFEEVNTIFNKQLNNNIIETIEIYNYFLKNYILNKILIKSLIYSSISPYWDRTMGGFISLNNNQCKKIFDTNLLKIKYHIKNIAHLKIIVAHCPQFIKSKTINISNCNEYKNKIYNIDVGMSRAFDQYKDLNELYILLNNFNIKNLLLLDHKDFYKYSVLEYTTRIVSILKITNNNEQIITGKLSIDYFYDTTFNNIKDKYLYLLSDIKRILLSNLTINISNIYREILQIINSIINKINLL